MTYDQFVEALRPLLAQAHSLFDRDGVDQDPEFRGWRHRVTDLIERIDQQGYEVNSSITMRYFDQPETYSYTPSQRDRLDAYNRDLQGTINELDTIIEGYEAFGDPKAPPKLGEAPAQLKRPKTMTLSWLWNNADISFWWWLGGVLVAVFLLGIALGQSTFYAQLNKPWSSGSAAGAGVHKTSQETAARIIGKGQ